LFLLGRAVAQAPTPVAPSESSAAAGAANGVISTAPVQLKIGPGDEAEFSVYGVPDLAQKVRVNNSGEVLLPMIGSVTVGGLTAEEAGALIEKKMVEGKFLKNPHVNFNVKEYMSEGVAVLGEVAHPGTYSAFSARRLFDAFQAAGGLSQRAGSTITITHKVDPDHPIVVTLTNDPVKSVQNNVGLQPGDSVVVSKAGIVYVLGEVVRPGGFVIENNSPNLSLTQVLAMAAGPTRMGNLSHAKLMHRAASGIETRDVDIKKIMQAKAPDEVLLADDIVFIPPAKGKMAAEHGSSILSALATAAIYRF